jgi:hypothetical protein
MNQSSLYTLPSRLPAVLHCLWFTHPLSVSYPWKESCILFCIYSLERLIACFPTGKGCNNNNNLNSESFSQLCAATSIALNGHIWQDQRPGSQTYGSGRWAPQSGDGLELTLMEEDRIVVRESPRGSVHSSRHKNSCSSRKPRAVMHCGLPSACLSSGRPDRKRSLACAADDAPDLH